MDPPDGDIGTFLSFTCTESRETAVKFLQGRGGNVGEAVADYFDTPDKYSQGYQGYDASQFGADRDGSKDMYSGIPSFNIDAGIEGMDVASCAPTRPPSRRSHYSNKSGGQDNGTINSLGQDSSGKAYFGPATREDYGDQWAMVPISSAARVYENPGPEERRRDRENDEPVFFKPLTKEDPLSSLIAILGQIQGARKELLCETAQMDHYGSNDRWWDGEDARAGEARQLDDFAGEVGLVRDVVEETQRLMAFVQESDRSYGSVEQLQKLPFLSQASINELMRDFNQSFTADVCFLVGWTQASEIYCNPDSQSLFKSVAVERNLNAALSDEQFIYRLELEMGLSEPKQTLYQAIDNILWASDRNGDSDTDSFLHRVSSVLTMRVKNRHTNNEARGLGLLVPTTFCADRYLESSVAAMKQARRNRADLREQLGVISERKESLNKVPHPKQSGKLMDRAELFEKTIKFMRNRDKVVSAPKPKKESTSEQDVDISMAEAPARTKWDEIADALEREHDKIKEKLQSLDDQRAKIEKQIQSLGNIFTENAVHDTLADDQPPLQKQYALRGVGIGPDYETTFVYVDPAPSTDSQAMGADGQWWKIEFEAQRHAWGKPNAKKVTEEEVITKTSNEAKEATLVYAERSLCDPSNPANIAPELWPCLKFFIDSDNAAFANEVAESRGLAQAQFNSVSNTGWPSSSMDMDGTNDEGAEARPTLPPRSEHPPPYDSVIGGGATNTEYIENLKVEADDGDGDDSWVPDLGPSLVSDEEYAANVNYAELGTGRGVSTMKGSGTGSQILSARTGNGGGRIAEDEKGQSEFDLKNQCNW